MVVAQSFESFNRGSRPVFSGNLDTVEVNSQPLEGVRSLDQVLYVRCIIFHIEDSFRRFNSHEGPGINSAHAKFAFYCATYIAFT